MLVFASFKICHSDNFAQLIAEKHKKHTHTLTHNNETEKLKIKHINSGSNIKKKTNAIQTPSSNERCARETLLQHLFWHSHDIPNSASSRQWLNIQKLLVFCVHLFACVCVCVCMYAWWQKNVSNDTDCIENIAVCYTNLLITCDVTSFFFVIFGSPFFPPFMPYSRLVRAQTIHKDTFRHKTIR